MRSHISLRSSLVLILGLLVFLAVGALLSRFSVWSLPAIAKVQEYLDVILIGVLSFGILLSIFFALWKIPKKQASRVPDIKDRLTIENAARQTLAQIVGGAVLLAGLFFTWANLKVTQEGQITDRYTKAIAQLGQLGDDNTMLRLGGIYALARIAKDSEKDHWPIMEVLTVYVRKTIPWSLKEAKLHCNEETISPRTYASDIEAVLTVLKRRTWIYEKEGQYLDLRSTDLSQADLQRASLKGAQLQSAHLKGAYLSKAVLPEADFYGACLVRADLKEARLEGANFRSADLRGADFSGAKLEGANFRSADLRGADFSGAKLEGANFQEAVLE